MNRRETEARIREIDWPTPSPDLRERVLSAVVPARPRVTWSDRVWFSRGWRLSALLAAVVVVAVDQLPTVSRSTGARPGPHAVAQAQAVDGAARMVGMPPELAASFARRALSEASQPGSPAQIRQAVLEEFAVDLPGGTQ